MGRTTGGRTEALTICARCGVMLGQEEPACSACAAPRAAEAVHAIDPPDDAYWVAVRATFTCNACRFDAPLDDAELDDSVVCARCGIEQRYDPAQWRELALFAHEVGDLATVAGRARAGAPADEPDGNPYERLDQQSSVWAERGHGSATLGHPACPDCQAPLRVAEVHRDHLDLACSRCARRASYELPRAVRGVPGLRGVFAPELERGARDAQLEGADGVTSLRCPGCGASLGEIDPRAGLVRCRYCDASCRVSARAHARAGHAAGPPKTWWMLFAGTSPLRLDLERRARGRAYERGRRAKQAARAAPRASEVERAPESTAAVERRALVPLLAVFAFAIVGGAIIFLGPSRAKQPTEAERASGVEATRLFEFQFDLTNSQLAELFAQPASDDFTVAFRPGGVARKARFTRGVGNGPRYSVWLEAGEAFEPAAALARLRALAPNQLQRKGRFYEISVAKTLLRFDDAGPNPSIQVSTWERDDAQARRLANAFWGVARGALFAGAEVPPAVLELVNGPKLARGATLEHPLPIERASEAFRAAFATGACVTSTNLADGKERLSCEVDVDHALIRKLQITWPNAAGATPEAARLALASVDADTVGREALRGCLDRALGDAQKVVTDHATGAGELRWPMPSSRAELVLDAHAIVVRSPGDAPAPDWFAGLPAVLRALEACPR